MQGEYEKLVERVCSCAIHRAQWKIVFHVQGAMNRAATNFHNELLIRL
jgi:hypothetical protein